MENQCECGIIHYVHVTGDCLNQDTEVYEGKMRKWNLCEDCRGAYREMFGAKITSGFFLKDPAQK